VCGAPTLAVYDVNGPPCRSSATQGARRPRREKAVTGTVRPQSTAITRTNREGSPRIEERKRGHVYDYAERTTRYVLLDPDVERARGEAVRVATRERDRWF